MPINSPNATSSLAEKEANLSTTSSLNLFFNHADLKSMGVPISAVAGEKSVDLS